MKAKKQNAKFELSPNQIKNLKGEKVATKECYFTYPELKYILTSLENQKFKMIDFINEDENRTEQRKEQFNHVVVKLRKLEEKVSALYIGELGAIIDKI